jgi:hypothetical protein
MIMTESSFRHIKGRHGEIGMLQVIPTERHIKKIIAKHVTCSPKEKYCKRTRKADIYGRGGRLITYKAKRFLQAHPKYALEVGLGEMRFWNARYNKYLKRRFWKYYPHRYLRKKYGRKYVEKEKVLRKWWTGITRKVGELVWTSHYNWGSRIVISRARGYSYNVLKWYNTALGRKRYTKFAKYTPITKKQPKILVATTKKIEKSDKPSASSVPSTDHHGTTN